MKLGLIGLTSSGKTTLFNSLSKVKDNGSGNRSGNKKADIKIVPVPDKRLGTLQQIFKPKKKTPATIEFVDIAGLEIGGNGGGGRFLPDIRNVDALVHVLGCHENSISDPLEAMEAVNLELMVSDLESIEKRICAIKKQTRNTDPQIKKEADILRKIQDCMEDNQPARNAGLLQEELKTIKSIDLLTLKPIIYCANIAESDMEKDEGELGCLQGILDSAGQEDSEVFTVCARIEEEISQLDPEDKDAFMQDLGITESSLDKLVRSSYKTLGLISFLTAGSDEVRAWTIKKGSTAPAAASVIHSDIERGFIRAQTISFEKFMEMGSFAKAKEKGLLRSEGKHYIVNDGDIIDFRFNV